MPVPDDVTAVLEEIRANSGLPINTNPEIPEIRLVEPIYKMAVDQLRLSLEAYVDGDVAIALKVKEMDALLDKTFKSTAKRLTARTAASTVAGGGKGRR